MEESRYDSPDELYGQLLASIAPVEYCARLLHRDHLLAVEAGFQITVAVDFYEVWQYANPVDVDLQADGPESRQRERIVRKQAARAGLFYDDSSVFRPTMLPPHIIELNDMVTFVRANVLGVSRSLTERRKWARQLAGIARSRIVADSIDQLESTNEIDPELLAQLRSHALA
jgi:hypothetical protein